MTRLDVYGMDWAHEPGDPTRTERRWKIEKCDFGKYTALLTPLGVRVRRVA